MTSEPNAGGGGRSASQSLVGGIALLGLSVFALWASSDLDQGTLRAMGPGMLPRSLAILVGLSGLALFAMGLFGRGGDRVEPSRLRGPAMVALAILAFALTIRPVAIGPVTTPGLGMAVAGPLAILIGGYGTPEARARELVVLGLALTAFCMILFGDLLNLPIPAFPQPLTGIFPADWSQKAVLRTVAAIFAVAALVLGLVERALGRGRRSRSIDVAETTEGL